MPRAPPPPSTTATVGRYRRMESIFTRIFAMASESSTGSRLGITRPFCAQAAVMEQPRSSVNSSFRIIVIN